MMLINFDAEIWLTKSIRLWNCFDILIYAMLHAEFSKTIKSRENLCLKVKLTENLIFAEIYIRYMPANHSNA